MPSQPSTRPGAVSGRVSGSGTSPPSPVGSTNASPVGTPGSSAPGGPRAGSTVVMASRRPSGDHAVGPARTPSRGRRRSEPPPPRAISDSSPRGRALDPDLRAVGGERRRGPRAADVDHLGRAVGEVEDADVARDAHTPVGVRRLGGQQHRERPAVGGEGHGDDAAALREVVRRRLAGGQVDDHHVGLGGVVVPDGDVPAVRRQQHRCRVALGLAARPVLGHVDAAVGVATRAEDDGLGEVHELDAEAVLEERDGGSGRGRRDAAGDVGVVGQLLGHRVGPRLGGRSLVPGAEGEDEPGRAEAEDQRHPRCHAHARTLATDRLSRTR